METGGEDRFGRDEQHRVRNPAGSNVVSSGVASAPGRGTSSSAKVLLYIHTRPHDHVGAGSQILRALWTEQVKVSRNIFLFSIEFSNSCVGKKLHNSKFVHVAKKRHFPTMEHIKET
jgi:hypothetical protein